MHLARPFVITSRQCHSHLVGVPVTCLPLTKGALCIAAMVMLSGCAVLDGISFGLDVANSETTISLRHGDGKTILAAEQDGKTIRAHLRQRPRAQTNN